MRALLPAGLVALMACHAPESSPTGGGDPAGQPPPNIVLLLADDAGYADFGFQPLHEPDLAPLTPRIDSVAAEGARFTDFYMSACVCSPSRAGLLTGRYQERFGHEKNIRPGYMKGGMPLTERTVADRLREAGYTTGLVGKWHLGYPADYQPNQRGFDDFFGCLQGSRSYYPMDEPTPHRVLQHNGTPTPEGGYVTDRLGQAAVRFIHENREQPFFLFVSFTAPHGPLQGKPEDLELPAIAGIEKQKRRRYAALMKSLDDNVGVILDALDEAGIAGRTLVVFTNDNGGQTGSAALNTPLRERKGTLYEGGVRVPAAIRWPGVVAPGSVVETPAIALDLVPTFLAAAGAPRGSELDGVDLAPRLRGVAAPEDPRTFFWRRRGPDGPLAARRGPWKMVWNDRAAEPELYHLPSDLGESADVAGSHPEEVRELREALLAWDAELVDPLW